VNELARHAWTTLDHATPDEQTKARRYVASIAHNADDCRELLDILGLLARPVIRVHGMPGYRKGCRCKTCRKGNAMRNQRQRARKEPTT
jgi:hypothetical protein